MDTFYLGIGAPRCGTSWLYANIRDAVPDLYLPPVKELRYFGGRRSETEKKATLSGRGAQPSIDPRDNAFFERWEQTKDGDIDAYLSLFPETGKVGEISPIYCTLAPDKVAEVKKLFGSRPVKVFFMIRNPYRREVSHVIFSMHRNKKRTNPYALKKYLEHVERKNFGLRSNYARAVKLWQNEFGSDFHIFYYDDLAKDPEAFFEHFASTMGLEYNKEALQTRSINTSGHKSDYAVKLPTALLTHLAQRNLKRVKRMEFLPEEYRKAWIADIEAQLAPDKAKAA